MELKFKFLKMNKDIASNICVHLKITTPPGELCFSVEDVNV